VKFYDSRPTQLLIKYSAALFSPFETDNYVCLCSSTGCLPMHYILRNSGFSIRWRCHLHQGYRVWSWMRACGICDSYEEFCLVEAARFELFNRLDMSHTCCLKPESSDSEKCRAQQVSPEKKTQLDPLIRAYQNSHGLPEGILPCLVSACECPEGEVPWDKLYIVGGDLFGHWALWWSKAKRILPVDLSLEP
jgi:hypothetical protein